MSYTLAIQLTPKCFWAFPHGKDLPHDILIDRHLHHGVLAFGESAHSWEEIAALVFFLSSSLREALSTN